MRPMSATCIYCDQPVNLNKDQVYRKVTCWAEISPKGKITRTSDPIIELRQYAHRVCHEYRGNTPGSLF